MQAEQVLNLAHDKGVMIATAESCTGGLISGALTEVPGSSDVFDRGFVTYSNAAKTDLLEVDPTLIERHGAVSEDVARAMVAGALAGSSATLAVSVTGVAGPGGTIEKPEGMVCFGLGYGTQIVTETKQFGPIGRSLVRQKTVEYALSLLGRALVERTASPSE